MIIAPKSKLLKQRQGNAPTIVQILPAMVRGGVERGTVEMADAIQKHGGRAIYLARWANGKASRPSWGNALSA
jgi:hypothetical protein